MPLSKSPTQLVVVALIGLALAWASLTIVGLKWGLVLVALLVYEAWTLINDYPNDTISEIIWTFAKRPMVPFIFGAGFAAGIQSGRLSDPWLVAALGFLMGHFFFQRVEE